MRMRLRLGWGRSAHNAGCGAGRDAPEASGGGCGVSSIRELGEGDGRVRLPHALRGNDSHGPVGWSWPWVVLDHHCWHNRDIGKHSGHQLGPGAIQAAERLAALTFNIIRPAASNGFRHSAAACALERVQDLQTMEERLDHSGTKTIMS